MAKCSKLENGLAYLVRTETFIASRVSRGDCEVVCVSDV